MLQENVLPGEYLIPDDKENTFFPAKFSVILRNFQLNTDHTEWTLEMTGVIKPVTVGNLAVDQSAITIRGAEQSLLLAAKTQSSPHLNDSIFSILFCSPFLLDQWAQDEDWLKSYNFNDNAMQRCLILYRLSEIFLSSINLAVEQAGGYVSEDLRIARILLIRQRFRYLAAFGNPKNQNQVKKIKSFLPDYEHIIRNAQRAYGQLILDTPDEVNVALDYASAPKGGWNLDQEVSLLLFRDEKNKEIWPFVSMNMSDIHFTNHLLKDWMLSHDDLGTVTKTLAGIEQSSSKRKITKVLTFSILHIRLSLILSAILLAIFTFLPKVNSFQLPMPGTYVWLNSITIISAAIFLIFFIFGLSPLLFAKKLTPSQKTYPLALRIPAMGLVGLLAAVGFVEVLTNLLASNSRVVMFLCTGLLFGFYLLSFLYIFLEISTRSNFWKENLNRAANLFFYGWATTYMLSALAISIGWLLQNPTKELQMLFQEPKIGLLFLLVSSISLLIGVFTQIFWEDKSVAEPL